MISITVYRIRYFHSKLYIWACHLRKAVACIYFGMICVKAVLFQNSTFNRAFEYSYPYLVVGGTSKGGNANVTAVLHGECVLFLKLAVGKRQHR